MERIIKIFLKRLANPEIVLYIDNMRKSKSQDRSNRYIGYKPRMSPSTLIPTSKMPFGKHQGRLIQDILNTDMSYMRWLKKETSTKLSNDIINQIS